MKKFNLFFILFFSFLSLALVLILICPFVLADDTTPPTDFIGWLFNSISNLWEYWFGGVVINTSTDYPNKIIDLSLYQENPSGNYYKVLSKEGNESVYDVNFERIGDMINICFTVNDTKKQLTGVDEVGGTIQYTYKIPDMVSIYKSDALADIENPDRIIKQMDVPRELIKSNPESPTPDVFEAGDIYRFCYLADPAQEFYLKFGESSVVVILEREFVSSAILTNVTAETGVVNFTHLNITTTAPYNTLLGYWSFDGDKENTKLTTAYDWSKNGNDGTYAGDALANITCGLYGKGGCFDGNGDYITSNIKPSKSNGAISLWIKRNGAGSASTNLIFYNYQYGGTGVSNRLYVQDNGGSLQTTIGLNATGNIIHSFGSNWNHVLVSYNTTDYTVYFNGVLNGTFSKYAWADLGTSSYFGSTMDLDSYFNGTIDEVMIFNSTLTAVQVSNIYNNQTIRFPVNGTQDAVNVNVSGAGNENALNITLGSCQKLMGSNLSIQAGIKSGASYVYNQSIMNFTGCALTNYTFVGDPNNISLRLIFFPNAYQFYSPLLTGNITINSYYQPTAIDTDYPIFSAYAFSITNNTEYSTSLSYQFNATITSTNGTAWLDFNGTNYSLSNTSTVYNKTFASLKAGTYAYYWWAVGNGTNHQVNITPTYYYTVAVNTSLVLGISGTTPITYGTITDVAGSGCPAQLSCALNQSNAIYGAGTMIFNYSTAGNENYSTKSITKSIVINKATPVLTFLANGGTSNLSLTYPQTVNISAVASSGTVGLDKDNIDYLANNYLNIILQVGSYIFRANISGNQNYSDVGYSYYNVTVNKSNDNCNVFFNETSPLLYNALFEVWTDCTSAFTLYRNVTVVANGSVQNLTDGNYNFTVIRNDSQNYTYITDTEWFEITSKIPTYTSVLTTPASPISYPTYSNFTCNNSHGFATTLYIDGVNKTEEKDLNLLRKAGAYLVNCTGDGNDTYLGSSEQITYTISKNSTYVLSVDANPAWTNNYPTITTVTGSGCLGVLTCSLFRNSTAVANPDIQTLFPGIYNYTYNTSGDENYSAVSVSELLTILDITPPAFDNLRNFTTYANYSFSQSITASDYSGIDSYTLNQTTTFNINRTTGLITNVTNLSIIATYWLNITVNDTKGNKNSGVFYINVIAEIVSHCSDTYTVLKSSIPNTRPYGKLCYWISF